MNIDERLEALTQSVRLLAQMHRHNERNAEAFKEEMRSLAARVIKVQEKLATIIVDRD
jgi:hypothetical protein